VAEADRAAAGLDNAEFRLADAAELVTEHPRPRTPPPASTVRAVELGQPAAQLLIVDPHSRALTRGTSAAVGSLPTSRIISPSRPSEGMPEARTRTRRIYCLRT